MLTDRERKMYRALTSVRDDLRKIADNIDMMVVEVGFRPEQRAVVELLNNGIRYKCPKCDAPMQRRINKTKGTPFMGCSNYPRCKGTQPYEGTGSAYSAPDDNGEGLTHAEDIFGGEPT